MTSTLEFYAPGTPAPQGSKRHVGGGRLIEASKKVAPWRQDVRYAAADAILRHHWQRAENAVAVDITFWLPRPTSQPRRRRTLPWRKPDIDKLTRSTLDALTSAGVYADDARVTDLNVRKRYVHPDQLRHPSEPDTPGARIRITTNHESTP